MRLGRPMLMLAAMVGLMPSGAAGAEDEALQADEQLVRSAGLKADGAFLLDFFRKRTVTEVDQVRLEALIRQLGASRYRDREKASAELVEIGPLARHALERARGAADLEVARRAGRVLKRIDNGPNAAVLAAAARLLAARRPPEAAGALLAFLPFAEDGLREDVRAALVPLALHDGKPEPVFVKALGDANPLRRGAAAAALCRAGVPQLKAKLEALLHDREPRVRLRVALAFFARKDKRSLPALIDLLGELPAERRWEAEDALYQVAGETGPPPPPPDAPPEKVRDPWLHWWRDQGDKVDLAQLDRAPALAGYTVLAVKDQARGNTGRVIELGRDGKPRWEITGLLYPLDVQVLSAHRVLIAENSGGRVTERDHTGKVLWEARIDHPVSCQRLANGNTFIAASSKLTEVDRAGKALYAYDVPAKVGNTKIIAARKLPSGQILCLCNNSGSLTRLDAAGKVVKSFPVGKTSFFASTMDLLPGGRILVPVYIDNKVVEFDAEGKVVWQAVVKNPVSAFRLPNGNTLVASPAQRRLVEITRDGKEVAESTLEGQPRQARRR